jgi:hypothetical protein
VYQSAQLIINQKTNFLNIVFFNQIQIMGTKNLDSKFEIGQRVVCIDALTYNVNYPFVFDTNKIYIINDIKKCSCGETILILKNGIQPSCITHCSICGNKMAFANGYLAFRFKLSHLKVIR